MLNRLCWKNWGLMELIEKPGLESHYFTLLPHMDLKPAWQVRNRLSGVVFVWVFFLPALIVPAALPGARCGFMGAELLLLSCLSLLGNLRLPTCGRELWALCSKTTCGEGSPHRCTGGVSVSTEELKPGWKIGFVPLQYHLLVFS